MIEHGEGHKKIVPVLVRTNDEVDKIEPPSDGIFDARKLTEQTYQSNTSYLKNLVSHAGSDSYSGAVKD